MPATPSATSTMPKRHGRPNESLMMMAGDAPVATPARRARSRISRADRSGSSGRSVTTLAAARFDASTPALAHTKPCGAADDHAALHAQDLRGLAQHDLDLARVAIPSRGESDRLRTRLDVVRSTRQPSALETIFWVTTRTSPCARRAGRFVGCQLAPRIGDERGQVVTRLDLGQCGQRDGDDRGHCRQPARRRSELVARSRRRSVPAPGGASDRGARGRRACRGRSPARSSTTCTLASASAAARRCAAKLSGPKCGSMTSGGASSSAFVPLRASAGAMTTSGAPLPAASAASAASSSLSSAATSSMRQVRRQHQHGSGAGRDGGVAAGPQRVVQATHRARE